MSVTDARLPAPQSAEGALAETGRGEGGYNLHLIETTANNAFEHIRVNWRDWLRVLRKRRWVVVGVFLGRACSRAVRVAAHAVPLHGERHAPARAQHRQGRRER